MGNTKIFLQSTINYVENIAGKIPRSLGFWHCAYCNKMHSSRTIRFDCFDGMTDDVCAPGVQAMGIVPTEENTIETAHMKCRVFLTPSETQDAAQCAIDFDRNRGIT